MPSPRVVKEMKIQPSLGRTNEKDSVVEAGTTSCSNVTRLFNFRFSGKEVFPYSSAVRLQVITRADTVHIVSILRIDEQTGCLILSAQDSLFDFLSDISGHLGTYT